MEIAGKIISLLPLQKGTGKNGEWKKQEFILETQSNYPKKVCIALWGPKIDQFKVKAGDIITAKIEVESREFNGKWYTDIKAYQINSNSTNESTSDDDYSQDTNYKNQVENDLPSFDADDLPF
ncbi:MAG TPA: DUF3127 domain-containing protein [Cytophagales bacterium]|nr:DUF3127 domain-containing protein [Cytophagales bacterium]